MSTHSDIHDTAGTHGIQQDLKLSLNRLRLANLITQHPANSSLPPNSTSNFAIPVYANEPVVNQQANNSTHSWQNNFPINNNDNLSTGLDSQFSTDFQFDPNQIPLNQVPDFSIPIAVDPKPVNNPIPTQPWQTNYSIGSEALDAPTTNWQSPEEFQKFSMPLPGNGAISPNLNNFGPVSQQPNQTETGNSIKESNISIENSEQPNALRTPEPTNLVKAPQKSEIGQPKDQNSKTGLFQMMEKLNFFKPKGDGTGTQKELSPKDQLANDLEKSISKLGEIDAAHKVQELMDKLREKEVNHEATI